MLVPVEMAMSPLVANALRFVEMGGCLLLNVMMETTLMETAVLQNANSKGNMYAKMDRFRHLLFAHTSDEISLSRLLESIGSIS
jgi:hypothetical protein